MKISVLSPQRKLVLSLPVKEITLTGSEGEIQILPGHTNMVGSLESGAFRYRGEDGSITEGFISTGFFEVTGESVSVMAETLELAGEIDSVRAKKAQRRAEERLSQAGLEEGQFKKYQLKLQRALIRQQISAK